MLHFKSPQTGSDYTIVNTGSEIFVAYRQIDDGNYRVRIQGPKDALEIIRLDLPLSWGTVKGDDHLSIVVESKKDLANAVADAIRAVMLYHN